MKNILKISTLFILIFTTISCGNSESKHTDADEHKSEQTEDQRKYGVYNIHKDQSL